MVTSAVRLASVLAVLAALLCLILPAVAEQHIVRSARLLSGTLLTTRSPLPRTQNRRLIEISTTHDTWVLGFPASMQHEVHGLLSKGNGHVLHPLPGDHHHWIVSCTPNHLNEMMVACPEMTAALLSADHKISPDVKEAAAGRNSRAVHVTDGVKKVTLRALLPHASYDQTQAAAQSVSATAPAVTDCGVDVKAGRHALAVTTCLKDIMAIAQLLASQDGVTWVDVQYAIKLHNLHAGAVIQAPQTMLVGSGATPPVDVQNGVNSDHFPIWKAGIDGSGQVVGVIDTGFDTDSCFLFDPKIPNPLLNVSRTSINPYQPPNSEDNSLNQSVTYTSKLQNVTYYQSPNHRKVVQLVLLADSVPDPHGTHTSTTIAGSIYPESGISWKDEPLLATGIAPEAKLALMDANLAGTEGLDVGTMDPGQLFDIQRQAGARISSNSYGGGSYGYDAVCFSTDMYTWAKDDMLLVYSAGNDGLEPFKLDTGTVDGYATCKNVLSVGATENYVSPELWPYELSHEAIQLVKDGTRVNVSTGNWSGLNSWYANKHYYRVQGGDLQVTLISFRVTITKEFVNAFYGMTATNGDFDPFATSDTPNLPQLDMSFNSQLAQLPNMTTIQIVMASPVDACDPLTASYRNSTRPTVLLVRQSFSPSTKRCSGSTSLQNVYNSGAAGVMIYWEDAHGPVISGSSAFKGMSYPAVTLLPDMGKIMEYTMRDTGALMLRIDKGDTNTVPFENVADFSSFGSFGVRDPQVIAGDGPTNIFAGTPRIKPDIVAPGYLLSGATDGVINGTADQCFAIYAQGTSMSAPVASGSAALIRQYFTDGFYPTGKANAKNKLEPSAALLKAVMVAGAAAMTGISRVDGVRLGPTPNPFEGFGRIDLTTSLPLAGQPNKPNMQVLDRAQFTDDGIAHNYTLTVPANDKNQSLIIVLAYHDFPAFPGATDALINNLNLVITSPNGTVYWGNGVRNGDYLNNIEKVNIANPPPGDYQIQVQAAYLFTGARPQPYALVALGNFKGALKNKANPAMG